MADAIALEILATGDPEVWRRFVRSSDREIDLSRAKISNESLNYFDFANCLLDETVFDDCLLASAKFENIFLRQARFRKCELSGASFRNTDLSGTVFDRCELYNSDFGDSVGIESSNIQTSFGDDSTITPEEVERPGSWYNFLDDEIGDESPPETYPIPRIPARVFAPVETDWQNGRLVLRRYDNASLLSDLAKAGVILGLKFSLNNLFNILKDTNFDQRIVDLVRSVDKEFPDSPTDFGARIFSLWFSLRPVFEYARATKGQHSDYLEAQIFSFELNFRDALNSYPEWREYQATAQSIIITQNFDEVAFIKHQISFAKDLLLVEDHIDRNVSDKLINVAKI